MADEYRLTIDIQNAQPVLLEDFTRSFGAVADEYQSYVRERGNAPPPQAQLYIREIRAGSIIADLVARHGPELAVAALPFVEHANSVVEFAGYLRRCYLFLIGKEGKTADLTKASYENLSAIVEPTAKDAASQINITGTVNGNVIVNVGLDSMTANAAQNTARREIEALAAPATGLHEKVAMYLYHGRNDPKSDKGDRAIIESIYEGHVKVVFVNEMVKAQMLRIPKNPFESVFVVDVSVETVRNKPVLYRVLTIHEFFDKPK